jgi:hypothetical protein
MGCVPITISGILELLTMVVAPFGLGFLIVRWWSGATRQITLALMAGLFAAALKILSTSLYTGKDWFTHIGGLVAKVGVGDPIVGTIVLVVLFPVVAGDVATALFIFLKWLGPPRGPLISVSRSSGSNER